MEEKKQNNIDSTNIFDEFSNDENLKEEVKKAELNSHKGKIYYLNLTSGFLKMINLFFILIFLIFFSYSYIQLDSEFNNENKEFLTPFCSILQNTPKNDECSSVATDLKSINNSLKKVEIDFHGKILGMVGRVFELANFAFTKESLFILDKADTRLKPLFILNEFDKLKTKFEPLSKKRLKCSGIKILSTGTFAIKCEAFSSGWNKEILGYSGKSELVYEKKKKVNNISDIFDDKLDKENQELSGAIDESVKKIENIDEGIDEKIKKNINVVQGSSISYASSFINFIEKNSEIFEFVDKPKKFSSLPVVTIDGFTQMTSFKIKLRLKNNNGLLK